MVNGIRAPPREEAKGAPWEPQQPERIDGGTSLLKHLGFVVRRKGLLTGRDYCLYSVLREKALHGYIGICSGESISKSSRR
jgi:hypothetical protein